MKSLILIKLGGSVITDKNTPYTAKPEVIKRLAAEIKEAQGQTDSLFLLGNGAGSFGHVPAQEYCLIDAKTDEKSLEGVALTHNAVAQLNLLVASALLEQKIHAMSISPASCIQADKGKITSFQIDPLTSFLNMNMTPVVYGDVVSNSRGGYSVVSTDTLFGYLAQQLKSKFNIKKIIHVGITDGVLDKEGKTVPIITKDASLTQVGSSEGIDVTGGMRFKVQQSQELAEIGIETWIINGTLDGELIKAIKGEFVKGTMVKVT